MIKFTISHNGKEYDNLESAFLDTVNEIIVETLQNEIKTKLKHLTDEIKKEGGKIILNIGDVTKGENSNASVSNVSPELLAKIQQALSE